MVSYCICRILSVIEIVTRICDFFFLFIFWQWLFCFYIQSHFIWSLNKLLENFVVPVILFDHPILLILFVNSLHFPKLLSAACEITILTFRHSKRILLLSGISSSFCWILCLYNHHMLSSLSIPIVQWSIFSLCAVFLGKCDHFDVNINLAKVKTWSEPNLFLCKISRLGIVLLTSCLQWNSL